jgi:hypothetical protein
MGYQYYRQKEGRGSIIGAGLSIPERRFQKYFQEFRTLTEYL